MGYDYEELMNKYRHRSNELTAEEIDFLVKESKERLIAGMPISVDAFYLGMENYNSYEYGDVTDIWSHGWVVRELIVHINGKHYYTLVAWHDDYGIDEDDQLEFKEAVLTQVLVDRWVEVKDENRD